MKDIGYALSHLLLTPSISREILAESKHINLHSLRHTRTQPLSWADSNRAQNSHTLKMVERELITRWLRPKVNVKSRQSEDIIVCTGIEGADASNLD